MAATASIIHLLNKDNDEPPEVLVMDDVYGGTGRYFRKISMGPKYKFIDMTNLDNVKNAITPSTKMIWLETPTNPTLKISNIKAIAQIGRMDDYLAI